MKLHFHATLTSHKHAYDTELCPKYGDDRGDSKDFNNSDPKCVFMLYSACHNMINSNILHTIPKGLAQQYSTCLKDISDKINRAITEKKEDEVVVPLVDEKDVKIEKQSQIKVNNPVSTNFRPRTGSIGILMSPVIGRKRKRLFFILHA